MCGVAGIYNFNESLINLEDLKVFTDSMSHRGPDGAGYELLNEGSLGMGHRRLSILDLSDAGKQPFHYLNRYTIVYNGEIFNFNEIKIELMAKGYQFQSETDTEVLIAAYDCYGLDCLNFFNGMWAFALWDDKEKKLLLSRDRFGVKPLYYSKTTESTFAFASETRAFKFLRGYKRKINEINYNYTLANNYALEGLGYTLFEDIYQLLPGHYMFVEKKVALQQKRWYDIREHVKPTKENPESLVTNFYNLFRDACKLRLISDVPVATALSGGLDSSSIYSTVFDILNTEKNERISKESQLAVSAIFPGLENDERQYVEKAVAFTKGEVRWVTTDINQLTTDIEKDTELFDAISNAPITAIAAIYKGMKREGITVSLDGHGVDEMLYGYLYMVYDLWLGALLKQDQPSAINYAFILSHLYYPAYQEEKQKELMTQTLQSINGKSKIKSLVKNILGYKKETISRYVPVDLPALSDKPYNFLYLPEPERMLYYEFFQNSLPALLRNFDRAGMMNSIEIRMPFLDYRLVEFVFSLTLENKIGQGFTKKILREAMQGKMNEEVRQRTFKVGIASPFQFWAENHLQHWLKDRISKVPQELMENYSSYFKEYNEKNSLKNLEKIWYQINRDLIS